MTSPAPDVGNTNTGTTTGGLDTGATVTTTSSPGFIAAMDSGGDETQNPATGNQFVSGGGVIDDTVGGNIVGYVSLITSSTGSYTPVWGDNQTASYATIVASFKSVTVTTTSNTMGQGSTVSGSSAW